MNRNTVNPYLGEFELQRVLALIGYLATVTKVEGAKLSDVRELRVPGSNGDPIENQWLQVAENHPEFFSIYTSTSGNGEKTPLLRLWERNRHVDRPALEPDRIGELYKIAMQLHEAAIRFSDLKRNWYAFWVSSIAGLVGGVFGSWVHSLLKGD